MPRLLFPALMATILLAACSMTGSIAPDSSRYEAWAGEPVDFFHVKTVLNWTVAGKYELLVWNGPAEAWLLKVMKPCGNLHFADVMQLSSTMDRVSRVETVTVDGMACRIDSIRPVDVVAMRAAERGTSDAAESAPLNHPAGSSGDNPDHQPESCQTGRRKGSSCSVQKAAG